MPKQHVATLLGATCCVRLATLLRHVATCWVLLAQIWPFSNLSQQHPTCRNTVAKRKQHVGLNNVATCCVGMLRSFGRGFRGAMITAVLISETSITNLWAFQYELKFKPGNSNVSSPTPANDWQFKILRWLFNSSMSRKFAFKTGARLYWWEFKTENKKLTIRI